MSHFQKNLSKWTLGFCVSVILTACYLMTFFSLSRESTGNANKASSKTRQKPGSNLETNDIGTGIISSLLNLKIDIFKELKYIGTSTYISTQILKTI